MRSMLVVLIFHRRICLAMMDNLLTSLFMSKNKVEFKEKVYFKRKQNLHFYLNVQ